MKYIFEVDEEIIVCNDCPMCYQDKNKAYICKIRYDYITVDTFKEKDIKCDLEDGFNLKFNLSLTRKERQLQKSACDKMLKFDQEEYTKEEDEVMEKIQNYREKIVFIYLGDYLKNNCICVKVKNHIAGETCIFLRAILTNSNYIISCGEVIPHFYKNVIEKETLKELLIEVIPDYKLDDVKYFGF